MSEREGHGRELRSSGESDPGAGGSAADPGRFPRGEVLALAALAFIGLVTVAWWALALWPVAGETPEWLARTRAVCFNATETGLPDASGWLLLIGEPLGMVGVLAVVWKESLVGGLTRLSRSIPGRSVLLLTGVLTLAGLFATATRVVHATERSSVRLVRGDQPPASYPRLDRPAPATALTDQAGERFELADLRGRPVFVTFAFGHCETICPLVVRNALEARNRLARSGAPEDGGPDGAGGGASTAERGGPAADAASPEDPPARASEDSGRAAPDAAAPRPAIVVVTLDPWRDRPSRLPHLARKWGLEPGDRVLSGSIEEVQAVLDAWEVPRKRDRRTGDIAHPALVYLLDARGRIAFASRGDVPTLVALAGRL